MNAVHFYWDVQISPNAGWISSWIHQAWITACASDISSTLLIEMFDLLLPREGRVLVFCVTRSFSHSALDVNLLFFARVKHTLLCVTNSICHPFCQTVKLRGYPWFTTTYRITSACFQRLRAWRCRRRFINEVLSRLCLRMWMLAN